MIIGIGTDLLDMRRIEKINKRYPGKFEKFLLSTCEIAYDKNKGHLLKESQKIKSLAKRFAAKEAVSKACGVGICQSLSFKDITIWHGLQAPPKAFLSKRSLRALWPELKECEEIKLDLSLSDEYPYIQAFSILHKIKRAL